MVVTGTDTDPVSALCQSAGALVRDIHVDAMYVMDSTDCATDAVKLI